MLACRSLKQGGFLRPRVIVLVTWRQVNSAKLCGYSYSFILSSNNVNGEIDEHWLNLARQWVGVTLNLLRGGCSTPTPQVVAVAYETAAIILADPMMCNANSAEWSALTKILDDYNNGRYSSNGGPPHCDNLEPLSTLVAREKLVARSATIDGDALAETADGCCVRDDWSDEEISAANVLPCPISSSFGGYTVMIAMMNKQRCGAIVPTTANDAFLRLTAQLSVLCTLNGQLGSEWDTSVDTLAKYNSGSLAMVGGPCACNDTRCAIMKSQFAPHPASNLAEVVPRAAQWSSASIATVAVVGVMGTVGWVLFVSTLVIIAIAALVYKRRAIHARVSAWRGAATTNQHEHIPLNSVDE